MNCVLEAISKLIFLLRSATAKVNKKLRSNFGIIESLTNFDCGTILFLTGKSHKEIFFMKSSYNVRIRKEIPQSKFVI